MHRIGDQMSKTDLSKSNPSSQEDSKDLEECMQNIQSNLKMIYGEEEEVHLGSYNVNAVSGFHSQYISNKNPDEHFDSYRQHYTSQQSNNDFMLEEKNKQIRLLNKEIAELRKCQQMSQFEQYENYQKMIDNLKKEIQSLQQKVLNKEAHTQINSDRMLEYEELIKEHEQTINEQRNQIIGLEKQLKEQSEQTRISQNRIVQNKNEQKQLQNEIEEYKNKWQYQIQENQTIKKVVEDLQNDIDERGGSAQIVELIEQVLQTISQFIKEYYNELQKSEYSFKLTNELRNLIDEFSLDQDVTIWQGIDRLSSLVIAVFEQLTFDIKQIDSDQQKIIIMTQQIESLEQMTISLEHSLGKWEAVSKEQKQFLQMSNHQNKQEREDWMNILINKQSIEPNTPHHDKIIKNLEELNLAQNAEIKELKDFISNQQEQLILSKRTFQEENQMSRIYEQRLKKQHQNGLFLKELIEKLVHIVGNEETSQTISQIQELQNKSNEQNQDEIEIRTKLEIKESDLKYQINQNGLGMNEMIEKRREVEGLRNTLRNCQKQIEMNREKIEILIRELDHGMMLEKSKQMSISYLPKSFRNSQSCLQEKIERTMRGN